MERKKPDKHQYATPLSSSSYIYNLEEAQFCQSNNNMKDSLFFKYASSIIHVVPEDKLDLSYKNGSSHEQRETIFEISQVNDFQVDFFSRANPVDQEQNNYNNIAAKMKKKTMNKKLLAYNFSNFTIFIQKIDDFGRKQLKHSLEALRMHSNSSESARNKKEIKRASFYSGYTTSTSNEQLNIKKNSKKLMEQKKREDKKEAANRVKGFIEYKMLMNYNQAFQDLREYVQTLLKVSDVSTVKNGNQILQNFYLTQPNNDHSISIVRDLEQNISSSLVYTADHNFQFTQKEVTLTTPEKFGSSIGKFGITEKLLQKPALNSHQQSFVQTYRPKENFSSVISPRKFPPKDTHTTSISKPISFTMAPQRRHLIIRTNCYELPLLSDHYLTINSEKNYKDLTVIQDHCTKNEPETSNLIQAIVQELSNASTLLGNSLTKSNKSIENSINAKNTNIFSPKISKLQSNNSKCNVDNSAQNFKLNYQFKSTLQTLNEKKQGSDHCQNYYFLNHKNQELQKIKSNISPHKFEGQSAKIITSDRKPSYALSSATKEVIQKSQKTVRFDESTVNQIKIEENSIKANGLNKLQLNSKNYNIPPIAREERKQTQQNNFSKDQRIKSRSKINLVLQSPKRETIQKPIYYSPRQMAKQQPRIQYNYERSPRINSPYGYGSPAQIPKVSAFKEAQPPKQFQPHHNYKEISKQNIAPSYNNNIYQMNHKPTVANLSSKPTLGTPQKLLRPNQNTKRQYQYKFENQYPQSPAKVTNPTYLVNNLDKRQNVMIQNQQKISREQSAKKPSFYSPQVMKDPYLFSPQKVMVHQIQEPHTQKYFSPMPNNYIKQQYFANNQGKTQQLHKAVNFNNNYYTNNTQTNPIRQTQVVRNVFKQEDRPKTNHFKERPPSNKPPQERVNIFSNYSPLDSQLESQQRSNHFSKNSSELSRPKSMNQKIFITLRKDK